MKNQIESDIKNIKEKREQVIQSIAEQLRHNQFSVEFEIVENPKGIKIIHEVTQETMDALIRAAKERRNDDK